MPPVALPQVALRWTPDGCRKWGRPKETLGGQWRKRWRRTAGHLEQRAPDRNQWHTLAEALGLSNYDRKTPQIIINHKRTRREKTSICANRDVTPSFCCLWHILHRTGVNWFFHWETGICVNCDFIDLSEKKWWKEKETAVSHHTALLYY